MRPILPTLAAAALAAAALAAAAPTPALAATTIRSGHADVAARLAGGKLQLQIKHGSTWREPSGVVVALGAKARSTLPAGSFLGRKGTRVWMIPQTQRPGVPWLGWNTESLSSRQLKTGVTWTVERVSGPGRVAVFQTGSFGAADVLFDSHRARPGSHTIRLGVHAHGNWAFTRAGTYKLRLKLSATSRAGRALSDTATLTVRAS